MLENGIRILQEEVQARRVRCATGALLGYWALLIPCWAIGLFTCMRFYASDDKQCSGIFAIQYQAFFASFQRH